MLIACSATSDIDEEWSDRADAGDVGGPLPEAGSGPDTSAPVDSAVQRPPFDPKDEPVVCATPPCALQLVAGERHFCARMNDGTVRCWGDNTKGSLGVDDAGVSLSDASVEDAGFPANDWTVPTVPELGGVTQLSAGGTTTCALADGGARCWGGNDKGQLGLGSAPPIADGERHTTPSAVDLPSAALRIDVGPTGACAVLASGDVWCWGANTTNQLARTTATGIGEPAAADLGGLAVARTALGTFTGFAVTDGGDIVSWGAIAGAEGSVSARESSVSKDPAPLAIGLGSVTSFSVSSTTIYRPSGYPPPPPQGIGHACAVAGGEVFCWGATIMGALGSGFATPSQKPRRAVFRNEKAWPQQVVAAGDISCARSTDGAVHCAGDNKLGALGKGPETLYSTIFEPVDRLEGHVVALAAAAQTVCALLEDGRVSCWGSNGRSELGQGVTDAAPHPSPVFVRF